MAEKNFKKLFGERVRYLRRLSGLSQEQLAEKTGLAAKTISYIENGKNALHFSRLPFIAEGLSVPVYKLFVFNNCENNKELINALLESASEKEINVIAEVVRTILALK